jgi:hypothetical protein
VCLARFFSVFPGNRISPPSTELLLIRAVFVSGPGEFPDQLGFGQIMGLHQIFERFRMIPQFRIHQTDQQMGIHFQISGKIHAEK